MSESGSNRVKFTMSAGPVSISDRVRQAYGRQILYHYDPDFHALFDDTLDKLRYVFQTHGDVVVMQGEAVLGLEAASACAVAPGDKCLNLVSGVYGAGYARHFEAYSGQPALEVKVPYNQSIDPAQVEEVLKREGDVRFVAVVHSETPSGTVNPIEEICGLARQYGALTIVDAVSSLGGMKVEVDDWGVDLCIAGPHKCIGAAPGSALVAVSERAWEAMRAHPSPRRRSYLSLLDWKEMWLEERRFPFTAFVGQINGVNEALTMVQEEGLAARIDRHTRAARMCRAGVAAMGLDLWPASGGIMATCVTAAKVPEGIDADEIIRLMRERYGVVISGSLRELAGKVIRIGHMGHMAEPVFVQLALSALEQSLRDLGYPVELGRAAGAALNAG